MTKCVNCKKRCKKTFLKKGLPRNKRTLNQYFKRPTNLNMSAVRKKWYDGEIFTFPSAVRKFEQTSLTKHPTKVDQKEQLANFAPLSL